eukprot:scaffold1101_cov123-Cylindrotheca_fusiformis.AAC.4
MGCWSRFGAMLCSMLHLATVFRLSNHEIDFGSWDFFEVTIPTFGHQAAPARVTCTVLRGPPVLMPSSLVAEDGQNKWFSCGAIFCLIKHSIMLTNLKVLPSNTPCSASASANFTNNVTRIPHMNKRKCLATSPWTNNSIKPQANKKHGFSQSARKIIASATKKAAQQPLPGNKDIRSFLVALPLRGQHQGRPPG